MREIQMEEGRDGLLVEDNVGTERTKLPLESRPIHHIKMMIIIFSASCILISLIIAIVRPLKSGKIILGSSRFGSGVDLSGELQENVQFFYAEWDRPDIRILLLFANVNGISYSGPYCYKSKSCLFNGHVWEENEENIISTFTLNVSPSSLELNLQSMVGNGWHQQVVKSTDTDGYLFFITYGNEQMAQLINGVTIPHFGESEQVMESIESFAQETAEVYQFLQEAAAVQDDDNNN
jgi:hypothetical protein